MSEAVQASGLVGPPPDASPESNLREIREDVAMALVVYRAEARALETAFDPARDAKAYATAVALLDDPNAAPRDRRQALRLLEQVNRRLDDRAIAILRNQTERAKQPDVHLHQNNIGVQAQAQVVQQQDGAAKDMSAAGVRARVAIAAAQHSAEMKARQGK